MVKQNEEVTSNGHTNKLMYIPIGLIRENPVALRSVNRESEDYLGLADSVKKRGILIPVLVREYKNPEDTNQTLYGLIDGLQRYNAAMDAGLKEVPAQITTMEQAAVEESQIVANAKKIETKPVQYAQQICRLLERNPTMTILELAGKLSVSTGWIHKMLGMVRHLHDDIKPLVNDSRIKLSNAYDLAKLPTEEQAEWVDRAMTQDPGEFSAAVAARVKTIKEARRKGKAEGPAIFEPVAHARKWAEIKGEFNTPELGAQLISRHGIQTPIAAWNLAIAWCANMDPDSKVQQIQEHDAREAKRKADAEKRNLERTVQKQEEAARTRQELEAKIAARGQQPAGASA